LSIYTRVVINQVDVVVGQNHSPRTHTHSLENAF